MTDRAAVLQTGQEAAPERARRRWVGRHGMLRLALAFLLALPAMVHGEETRKVRSSVPPEYPELARRLSIRGVARVRVTVAADGSVTDVKELGGNPVLVEALTRAVKKWKYEPAEKASVLEVQYAFGTQGD